MSIKLIGLVCLLLALLVVGPVSAQEDEAPDDPSLAEQEGTGSEFVPSVYTSEVLILPLVGQEVVGEDIPYLMSNPAIAYGLSRVKFQYLLWAYGDAETGLLDHVTTHLETCARVISFTKNSKVIAETQTLQCDMKTGGEKKVDTVSSFQRHCSPIDIYAVKSEHAVFNTLRQLISVGETEVSSPRGKCPL